MRTSLTLPRPTVQTTKQQLYVRWQLKKSIHQIGRKVNHDNLIIKSNISRPRQILMGTANARRTEMCKKISGHHRPTIKIYSHKKICSVNAFLTQRFKRCLVMPAVDYMRTLRNRQQAPFMILGTVISSGKTKSLTNF